MASVVVEGLVLPVALGGHPALDFCNTRAGWGEPRPKEYLVSHAHLLLWARENGLVTAPAAKQTDQAAAHAPAEATAVLRRAVRFREALYDVLAGLARPANWAAVSAEAQRAAAVAVLRPGTPAATWELPVTTGAELPLLAVARSAADLLTTPAARTVAACPGHGCGWLFADPRGRRRWCSMALCGNRAKARRHSDRNRPAPAITGTAGTSAAGAAGRSFTHGDPSEGP
ncbi:ABATE domain-containing protein [Streptomyces sp. NBC_01537]|uniref:CGNR zinc finger domain-containing protein n=1 Tax=Streptomyces sp. NBC_01537 TaxID=2903896 RepID=UPI0038707BE5